MISDWTRRYKPISILKVYPDCDAFDEDKYTKIYMKKFGIRNARGGSYVTVKLTKQQRRFIRQEIYMAENRCLRCGRKGHYVKDCYAYRDIHGKVLFKIKCNICGKSGHIGPKCRVYKEEYMFVN